MRPKQTYSNVVSTLCLVLLLGGGAAYAAAHMGKNSVGAKQLEKNAVTTAKIKKNAVTSAKIKNGAVTSAKIKNGAVSALKVMDGTLTGQQINVSTLGTVPSAASVNGQTPMKIFKIMSKGESNVQVASIAGFSITATCEEANADVTLKSPSTPASVIEAQGNGHEGTVFEYSSAASGEFSEVRLDGKVGGTGDGYGETTFTAAQRSGTVLSGNVAYDYNTFGGMTEECVIFGEVTTG
jgi:hypothetical protein